MSAARYSPILSEPIIEEQRAAAEAVREDQLGFVAMLAVLLVGVALGAGWRELFEAIRGMA